MEKLNGIKLHQLEIFINTKPNIDLIRGLKGFYGEYILCNIDEMILDLIDYKLSFTENLIGVIISRCSITLETLYSLLFITNYKIRQLTIDNKIYQKCENYLLKEKIKRIKSYNDNSYMS